MKVIKQHQAEILQLKIHLGEIQSIIEDINSKLDGTEESMSSKTGFLKRLGGGGKTGSIKKAYENYGIV